MSQPVYILLRGNPRKPSESEDGEKPCGVVSDKTLADKFYADQTVDDPRDWVMFLLDEVPELSGKMTEEPDTLPEPSLVEPSEEDKERQELMRSTREKVEETTRKLQDYMNRTRRPTKR